MFKYPNLHEHIHECVEFGSADEKRRKEVIKVRTIDHIRENLESNYNEYMSRTCLNNYMLPRQSNSIAAKSHHHPTNIKVSPIIRDERKEHPDMHYCFASVREAKQFAMRFSTHSVIISQDDKAKVPLGIAAVGRTFRAVQSLKEPIMLPDHDFPIAIHHKLIPSVYMLMNPKDNNNTLYNRQLAIFIRSQYLGGTSSASHMGDLKLLTQDNRLSEMLKLKDTIKPIWVLLVDGGPDENPRHMKNIIQYSRMFRALDLDYLTVRTHAPYHSAYNPVERGMFDDIQII